MLGSKKARTIVNDRIVQPISNAVIVSCLALVVAVMAVFLAVAASAH
jgi:hypothetical protein